MKTIYKIIDRIVYAFRMYPTKNPNNWIYTHKIASSAYPDGSKHEYVNGCNINEINRNKVVSKK